MKYSRWIVADGSYQYKHLNLVLTSGISNNMLLENSNYKRNIIGKGYSFSHLWNPKCSNNTQVYISNKGHGSRLWLPQSESWANMYCLFDFEQAKKNVLLLRFLICNMKIIKKSQCHEIIKIGKPIKHYFLLWPMFYRT